MKFPLRLSKNYILLKIFMGVLLALSTALLVLSIITLFDVYTFLNLTYAQAKVQIATSCLSITVLTALLTMHYQVDDQHLRIKLLFFDILGGRIRLEKILNIVYSNGMMYISYIWKGQDPVIAAILIAPSKFDKMKDSLMQKNENIQFYEDKNETGNSK